MFVDLDAQTDRQTPPLGVRAGIESPPLLRGTLIPQHLELRWRVHSDFDLRTGLAVTGTREANVVVSTYPLYFRLCL